MIDAALLHIASQLNLALRRTYQVAEDMVAVSGLQEVDGSPAAGTANRLAIFVTNVEHDTVASSQPRHLPTGVRMVRAQPPVCLNLMVMFAANYGGSTYPEALKLIARTVAFFQASPVLDHQRTPDLDPRINMLTLEIVNLGLGELSALWGVLGGRYVPSVLYRVRLIAIDADQPDAQVPVVRAPGVRVNG